MNQLDWNALIQLGGSKAEGTKSFKPHNFKYNNPESPESSVASFAEARLKLKASLDSAALPSDTRSSLFFELKTEETEKGAKVIFLDGIAAHKFSDTMKLQIGKFKIPTGMDWLVPYTDLDIIERSELTTMITHGRNDGLMASGEIMANLSYNVGLFTDFDGDDNNKTTYAARLMFNLEDIHLETSYTKQRSAHAAFSFGVRYDNGTWDLRPSF